MTRDEYAAAHLPRFETMPHTAPVFDDRAPTADPQLFCMASKPGINGDGVHSDALTCTCLTEQGTKYEIPDGHCMRVARWGAPYNPYKERREDQQPQTFGPPHAAPVARPAPLAGEVVGEVGAGARPASYGAIRAARW